MRRDEVNIKWLWFDVDVEGFDYVRIFQKQPPSGHHIIPTPSLLSAGIMMSVCLSTV